MTVTAEIQITDRAQSHIIEQLKKSGSNSLRLGVKESGCNGFMYTLDYLTDTSLSDFSLFERSDLSVCAHEEDLPYVSGTEIDLVTEGLNSALVFKNPKAQSYCGCGESFSFESAGLNSSAEKTKIEDLAKDAGAPD